MVCPTPRSVLFNFHHKSYYLISHYLIDGNITLLYNYGCPTPMQTKDERDMFVDISYYSHVFSILLSFLSGDTKLN